MIVTYFWLCLVLISPVLSLRSSNSCIFQTVEMQNKPEPYSDITEDEIDLVMEAIDKNADKKIDAIEMWRYFIDLGLGKDAKLVSVRHMTNFDKNRDEVLDRNETRAFVPFCYIIRT